MGDPHIIIKRMSSSMLVQRFADVKQSGDEDFRG